MRDAADAAPVVASLSHLQSVSQKFPRLIPNCSHGSGGHLFDPEAPQN